VFPSQKTTRDIFLFTSQLRSTYVDNDLVHSIQCELLRASRRSCKLG